MKKPTFQRIVLMGGRRQDAVQETLLALREFLQGRGYSVAFDETTTSWLPGSESGVAINQLHETCDLLIVVGGDGSLLQAAKIAIAQSLPVLGVNRGRLGFLTDVYPQEFEKIEQVLQGEYHEERRFLLHAEIHHQNEVTERWEALNEIVLSPGNVAHMIDFEVAVNEQFVCDIRADGLIVATPTGSTAYALSGGGPILHPALNAMVMVPMFPHTLSNRPLVVDGDSKVSIYITLNNEATPFVSADGQKRVPIALGDTLLIRKHPQQLRLIHPRDYQYFQTLRSKLGWQSKQVTS